MTAITAATFAAAQAGDPAALALLLRQLQPGARRYARYQCHRGSAIEDVVQEALIILYRRVGTVRDAGALAGWMFRVIARLCMLPALALMRGLKRFRCMTKANTLPGFRKTSCASTWFARWSLCR